MCDANKKETAMLSPFGGWLRDFRGEREITLRQMAMDIGISAAHLSSMELGRKNVPRSIAEKISSTYGLNSQQKEELLSCAEISTKEVRVKFSNRAKESDREVAH